MTFASIPAGAAVFVDANTFIYHFTNDPKYGVACTQLLKRVELLLSARVEDHELPVEDVRSPRRPDLRKVTAERPAVAGLEVGLVAVNEGDCPKAIPLRLVGPLRAFRERAPRAGELGRERRGEGECHAGES